MNDIAPSIRQSMLSVRFTLLITFLLASTVISFGQSCNSELNVSKDRDARSANENNPTQFQLELSNNSSKSQTYFIETTRFENSFQVRGVNKNKLAISSKLNVAIWKNNNVVDKWITVPANSSAKIQVQISVPQGTTVNRWAAIEVTAKNNDCSNGNVSTLLKLFVTDPSEE